MPDNILIDNYEYGYPHIHPNREKIKTNSMEEVLNIVKLHIEINKKVNFEKGIDKMIMTLIKKMSGADLINELNQKYGSKKELERLYKQTNNYEMLIDLENYNYFSKNPEEVVEMGESIVTNKLTLTNLDLMMLSTIKNNKIKSIRDLANKMNKDIKNVQPQVHKLAENGLLILKDGQGNRKIPYLNYDMIKIEI